ncbi:type I restriction endonuclease [Thermococcus sp.]
MLEQAVLEVMSRISSHRNLYLRNEEAVKQHLIGEIMQALGWAWSNPEEIRPEERTEDGRADYALILNGEIVAFLEAKNLSVNVIKRDEPLRQLARYCFSRGVRYGILTNGAKWIVVKSFSEGTSLRERILFIVDLEEEPLERATLKLTLLSKERILELEKISSLLSAFEVSYRELLGLGFGEEELMNFLKSHGKPSVISIEKLSGFERPRAVYVYENGWKPLPLGERTLKGALISVLNYLEGRSSPGKAREIRQVRDILVPMDVPAEKVLKILRGIEEEEGIRIGVEL